MEGALHTRAADREACFVGPEARLDEDPGSVAEGILQVTDPAITVTRVVDQRDTAWCALDSGTGGRDVRGGQ